MSFKEQIVHSKATVTQFWKAQSKKRKIIFFSILGAIIVISVILAIVLHKENYAVLYTKIDSTECSQIVSELKDMNIDSKVKQDGTILVPESKSDDARMKLATKGYPKTTFSYDIWTDNINMFTTDTDKKEYAKMQLQNRLQDTIATLSDVDSAIVTLDIPNTSNNVLSTNTDTASASVVLHLTPGSKLTSSQIKGITHIVAMAISGLDENNVSITDGNGNPLSGEEIKVDQVVQETQKLKFKRDLEDALKQEVMNLLTPSYGQNGVKVAVSASLDYDKKVSEGTQYTPSVGESGMVSQEDTEQASGGNGTSGGTVGVQPNADGTYPTQGEDDSTGAWTSNKKSTSYLVNTLKTQSEKQGYYIDNVKVSVVIYKQNLSEQERQSVTNATVNAAGTTTEFVSVENLPKYEDRANDSKPDGEKSTIGKEVLGFSLKAVAALCGLLIIIIIVVTIIVSAKRRKRRKMLEQLEKEQEYLRQQEEKENEIKKLTENPPETKEQAIRNEISDFSEKSPEVAAQLLKNWLREDEK